MRQSVAALVFFIDILLFAAGAVQPHDRNRLAIRGDLIRTRILGDPILSRRFQRGGGLYRAAGANKRCRATSASEWSFTLN